MESLTITQDEIYDYLPDEVWGLIPDKDKDKDMKGLYPSLKKVCAENLQIALFIPEFEIKNKKAGKTSRKVVNMAAVKTAVEIVRSNKVQTSTGKTMFFLDVKIGGIKLNGLRAGKSSKGTYVFEGSSQSKKLNQNGVPFENKHYELPKEIMDEIKVEAEKLLG